MTTKSTQQNNTQKGYRSNALQVITDQKEFDAKRKKFIKPYMIYFMRAFKTLEDGGYIKQRVDASLVMGQNKNALSQNITMVLSLNLNLNDLKLSLFSEAYGVSKEYLFKGTGEMFTKDGPKSPSADYLEQLSTGKIKPADILSGLSHHASQLWDSLPNQRILKALDAIKEREGYKTMIDLTKNSNITLNHIQQLKSEEQMDYRLIIKTIATTYGVNLQYILYSIGHMFNEPAAAAPAHQSSSLVPELSTKVEHLEAEVKGVHEQLEKTTELLSVFMAEVGYTPKG